MIGTITWVAPCAAVARQLNLRLAAALLFFSAALLPMSLPAQQVSATLRNAVQQSGGRVIIRLSQQGGAALAVAGDPMLSATAAAAVAQNLDNRYAAKARGRALRFGMLFAEVPADQLEALAADPAVESIEADFVSDLAEVRHDWPSLGVVLSDRTPDTVGWGVTKINAPAAWSAGVTGAGVKVGIMDSGIDIAHPDLGVSGGFDFTTSSASPAAYDDNIGICNGHGTHVAGIVAARQNGSGVVGVAPDALLYSLKVFEIISGGCKAWGSNQIAALDWAVANGLRVVSISIGGTTFSSAYQDAVTSATNAGVVVVAAAGNNSSNVLNFPGAYTGVTAVGSVNSSDIRSSWSNTGDNLWLAAPGEGIVSTMPGGGTGSKSGTSMATPHVSGLAALYLQNNPGASVSQVRNALRDVAIDIDAAGWDVGTGWGLAQAAGIGSAPPPPPPPVPLAMTVSPSSRNATVQAGSAAPNDSATVTLSGDNSASTAWSATKKKAWTTLTVASGSGSGKVKWNRSTSGLAAGTYVDTITVAAAGVSSRTVIDTLVVTAAPVPLAMTVSPSSRSITAQAGTAVGGDSATVTLSGDNSGSTAWSATKRKSWTTLTTTSGSGSGKVKWNRSTSGLAAGTYVDTITVAASGVSARTVIDTLVVTTAPVPLAMTVSPSSRKATVQAGSAAPNDSATVTLSGDNSGSTAWSATKRKSWTTLTTTSGTGSGKVKWNRSTSGLAAGTYVDTITVAATGVSSRTVIDTLVVTAAPVPLAMTVSPSSRSITAQAGTAVGGDSATVTLTGDNSGSTAWSATKKKSWTTLTVASGTGSGKVKWNRSTSGLAAGTYVDTITVAASGVSSRTVIDTLVVTTAPVPLAMTVAPSSRKATVQAGTAAPSDSATVTLSGDNSASTAWSATKRKSWTTLTTTSGTGSGKVKWNRSTSGLAAGTYVDTITVAASGVSARTVIDTLVVTQTTSARLSKGGGKTRTIKDSQGKAVSVGPDTTAITASLDGQSGDGTSAPRWVATTGASWIRFVDGVTPTAGAIVWTRDVSQLPVGQHIDSVVVALEGNPVMRGTYTDTVVVVLVPDPTPTNAVDELVRGNRLTVEQREFFDGTGNRNGRFDLGDFLAWIDRNGIRLSASLTAQLAEVRAEP